MRPVKRGFTLLEILIVVAIIGILATMLFGVIYASKYKARDVKRISDLKTIGTALELFRIDHGRYPIALNWVSDCGHAGNNWIPDTTDYDWADKYVSAMPRDPSQDCTSLQPRTYQYWSDGQKYQVSADLESPTPPQTGPDGGLVFDGLTFLPTTGQPVVANLTSGASNPTSDSPIPFTITFSRTVVDFTQAVISVTRGFISGLVALGDSAWSFFVTPTDNDVITVSISANTVHDESGIGNSAAQFSIEYDSLKPHLALSPAPLPSEVNGAFAVTLNSTLVLTDLSESSIQVTNGTVSGLQMVAPMDGRNYSFVVTPTSAGTVTIVIPADTVHSNTGRSNVASNSLSTTYTP